MNLDALYSTIDILKYLGAICNDTSILDDKKNRLNPLKDLELNKMHKIIYTAVENIYLNNGVKEVDEISINMFLSGYPDQHGYYTQNKGDELVQKIKAGNKACAYEMSLGTIKKFSLLREYEKVGFSTKDIYNTNLIDPIEISAQRMKFDQMSENDIRSIVKSKMDSIHEEMQVDTGDMFSFHAGDDIFELINSCKEEPSWGHSFSSKLFNRVFRGMQGSKLMLKSGGTGTGKTRGMLLEMVMASALERYDVNNHVWITNKRPASSVLITTELSQSECQLILLAIVSGVPEEIIKDGRYTPEVESRILKAGEVIKNSNMYFEFASDFSATDLECMIEKNINRHDTGFIFFDYVQVTPRFAQEMKKLFGYEVQEHQMLNLMVSKLKYIATKYDVFIMTASQLNRSYKQDDYPDATHLRGSQAMADKIDFGIITMRASTKDKEKLEKLMSSNSNFSCSMPTHGHHVFKNRGGKYTGIVIWVNMNLDNMTVEDCFVTTQDFEQIYVEPKPL